MAIYVYDKAKYHFDSVTESRLPLEQAYVHTGMFFGWLLSHGFFEPELFSAAVLEQFKSRQITAPKLFEREADGVLASDMLTTEGNAFTLAYFDFEKGVYMEDFDEIVLKGAGEKAIFTGEDTWANYSALAERIDNRFAAWKAGKVE